MLPYIFADKKLILTIFCSFLIASRKCDDALVTDEAALEMAVGNRPIGRIVIGLFRQIVPKTVENFVALANHQVSLYIT